MEIYRYRPKIEQVDKTTQSKVVVPNQIVLKKHKEKINSSLFNTGYFDRSEKYKYPKSWDNCQNCFENATESCVNCETS